MIAHDGSWPPPARTIVRNLSSPWGDVPETCVAMVHDSDGHPDPYGQLRRAVLRWGGSLVLAALAGVVTGAYVVAGFLVALALVVVVLTFWWSARVEEQ